MEGSSRILLESLKGSWPLCEIFPNGFHARGAILNGSVEGMNDEANWMIKKVYGCKSCEMLETALCHELAKLPEPESTHRFC